MTELEGLCHIFLSRSYGKKFPFIQIKSWKAFGYDKMTITISNRSMKFYYEFCNVIKKKSVISRSTNDWIVILIKVDWVSCLEIFSCVEYEFTVLSLLWASHSIKIWFFYTKFREERRSDSTMSRGSSVKLVMVLTTQATNIRVIREKTAFTWPPSISPGT